MATLREYLDMIELEVGRGSVSHDLKFDQRAAKLWLDWYSAKAMDDKAKAEARGRTGYSPAIYTTAEVKLSPDPGRPQMVAGTIPVAPMDLFLNNGVHAVYYYGPDGSPQPLAQATPGTQRFSRAQLFSKPQYARVGQRIEIAHAPFLERVFVVYIGSPVPEGDGSYLDTEYPLPPDLAGAVVLQVAKKMLGQELAPADATNNAREN